MGSCNLSGEGLRLLFLSWPLRYNVSMEPATILFLHGFASSGRGTKAQYLRERLAGHDGVTFHAFDFNPTPRDFEYLTTSGMINRLRQYLLDRGLAGAAPPERMYLVGSSMGGLVALNYAHRFGGIAALLLLAPALTYLSGERVATAGESWQDDEGSGDVYHYAFGRPLPLRYDIEVDGRLYQKAPPPPAPMVIVHGRQDQVVPVSASRAYARQYPEQVRLVEVDASHTGLNDNLDLIWNQLAGLLNR